MCWTCETHCICTAQDHVLDDADIVEENIILMSSDLSSNNKNQTRSTNNTWKQKQKEKRRCTNKMLLFCLIVVHWLLWPGTPWKPLTRNKQQTTSNKRHLQGRINNLYLNPGGLRQTRVGPVAGSARRARRQISIGLTNSGGYPKKDSCSTIQYVLRFTGSQGCSQGHWDVES